MSTRYKKYSIVFFFICLMLIVGVLGFHWLKKPVAPLQTSSGDNQLISVSPVQKRVENQQWLGLCKKNSVQTLLHFYATMQADPLLKNIYKTFNWSQGRLLKANTNAKVFVSYKKEGKVYWTREPIALLPYETLITDGVRIIRAHCCNEVSFTEKTPILKNDPPEYLLQPDVPMFWPELNQAPIQPMPDVEPHMYGLDVVPIQSQWIMDNRNDLTLTPVPEPGTFILFVSGGFFIWLWRFLFR